MGMDIRSLSRHLIQASSHGIRVINTATMDRRGSKRMEISVQKIGKDILRTKDGVAGAGEGEEEVVEVADGEDLEIPSESCAISMQTEGEQGNFQAAKQRN